MVLRYNKICSDNEKFDQRYDGLEKWLMERGYSERMVRTVRAVLPKIDNARGSEPCAKGTCQVCEHLILSTPDFVFCLASFIYNGKGTKDTVLACICHLSNILPDNVFND